MSKLLIKNARLVNEAQVRDSDVLIDDERIARIDTDISAPHGAEVIDAAGKCLLPGMIDDQVHFREPGMTHKGDLATESAAAAAGGITSFMDMPNVNPQTTTRQALADKYAMAAGRCTSNYGFYLGATNGNIEEIKALQVNEACGIKVFMGASTGDMLVDDRAALEQDIRARSGYGRHSLRVFADDLGERGAGACGVRRRRALHRASGHPLRRGLPALVAHGRRSRATPRRAAARAAPDDGGRDAAVFTRRIGRRSASRPRSACITCGSMSRDTRSSARRSSAIRRSRARRIAQALIKALNEGRIDIIATDHAPHTATEKAADYFHAPAGLPLVQHALLTLFDLVSAGEISVELLVDRACHAPADLFGVVERGYVREGWYADLVIVDPDKPFRVSADNLLSKCHWSPFEGHEFSSTIDTTIVNGSIVYAAGKLTGPSPANGLSSSRARRD